MKTILPRTHFSIKFKNRIFYIFLITIIFQIIAVTAEISVTKNKKVKNLNKKKFNRIQAQEPFIDYEYYDENGNDDISDKTNNASEYLQILS